MLLFFIILSLIIIFSLFYKVFLCVYEDLVNEGGYVLILNNLVLILFSILSFCIFSIVVDLPIDNKNVGCKSIFFIITTFFLTYSIASLEANRDTRKFFNKKLNHKADYEIESERIKRSLSLILHFPIYICYFYLVSDGVSTKFTGIIDEMMFIPYFSLCMTGSIILVIYTSFLFEELKDIIKIKDFYAQNL